MIPGSLTDLPDPCPIEPLAEPFDLVITPPGSKSLTCRAYLLAALAEGTSRIRGGLRSDDTDHLLAALVALGAACTWKDDQVIIEGVAGRFPRGGRLDLGEGGAPTRFMIAAATLAQAPVVIDAAPRMRERPVAELVDLLRALGASIRYLEDDRRLPVEVRPGGPLDGGRLEVGVTASSQSISAISLIAPWMTHGLTLDHVAPVTSAPYLHMTRSMLQCFGAKVRSSADARRWTIDPRPLTGVDHDVEPDATAATYWITAAAVVPGSAVRIPGLIPGRSLQGDADYHRVIRSMFQPPSIGTGADEEALTVTGPSRLVPIEQDMAAMPDAAMSLAVAAACADGPSRISGLATLRVKETDRIAALAEELGRIGCAVQAGPDWLAIDPRPAHRRPVTIRTYHDHRMAMAFAVLGLVRGGISIENPACVSKSYPGFWRDLSRITLPTPP